MKRWPGIDQEAIRALQPQAGRHPGRGDGARTGRDRSWSGRSAGRRDRGADRGGAARAPRRASADVGDGAAQTDAFAAAIAGATEYRREIVRLFGIPGVRDRRDPAGRRAGGPGARRPGDHHLPAPGGDRDRHPLRASGQADYEALHRVHPRAPRRHAVLGGRHDDRRAARRRCSPGADDRHRRVLHGGLLAARLTDRPGSSAYVLGGAVVYSNAAKIDLAGVDAALIERCGAVSVEVAEALADGIAARFGATLGVGITGVAGPGGRHRGQAGRHRLRVRVPPRWTAADPPGRACRARGRTCATDRSR